MIGIVRSQAEWNESKDREGKVYSAQPKREEDFQNQMKGPKEAGKEIGVRAQDGEAGGNWGGSVDDWMKIKCEVMKDAEEVCGKSMDD